MKEAEKTFIGGIHERLTEEKIIKEEDIDPNFIKDIIKYGGQDVQACLQCGNCTGVCPISLKIDYKTRNMIKLCQFGMKKHTINSRWVCATCYRCYEHCPANLNPGEVMVALRHIAVREGVIPPFIKNTVRNVLKYGMSVKPDEDIHRLRKELGLPVLPSTESGYGKVLNEIEAIVRFTKYDKLLKLEEEEKEEPR